mmetsp:Transcript_26669/g.74557  ORF Transcript_26669/g.74557 Transcript_26669/m.74557 type:complete len:499 (+) Transcript_26669:286-1782(+)|eukprot:CAMPEP_0119125224 /NCGR_PEP_ID=MMETSP1310-20130426/4557_1 /TAXON_ID=464262 /ORGANISM="Genus nov. species nov., Strain RCC2339" /LENGTH=498 /DNA_ID=CAMNT_0007115271 /DNA_START=284 /DNA_END=1780 /DNA_ORIENTATION=+
MFLSPASGASPRGRVFYMVDKVPARVLGIIWGVALVVMLAVFIFGLAGPDAHVRETTYTISNCSNSGVCPCTNVADCPGETPMSAPGYEQQINIPASTRGSGLAPINYQFALTVFPYNKYYGTEEEHTIRSDILVAVRLEGRAGGKNEVVADKEVKQQLVCGRRTAECRGFVVLLERRIDYTHYEVYVSFDGTDAVDNARWVTSYESTAFNVTRITVRTLFLLMAILLTVFWVVVLAHRRVHEWTIHQRGVLVLLVGLIFLNNPLFGFEFLSETWVLPVLDSFFTASFVCLLLLFWFYVLDHFRLHDLGVERGPAMVVKYIIVIAFGATAILTFVWSDMRFTLQPVVGSDNVGGLIAVYYVTSVLFGVLVIWLLVVGLLVLPDIYAKSHLEYRFLFLYLPAGVIAIELFIAIFAGAFGPFSRSLLAFLNFFFLFNGYVYLLVWGFYPTERWFEGSGVSLDIDEDEFIAFAQPRDGDGALTSENAARMLASSASDEQGR